MDRIQHTSVKVGDGLNLHVAEIGSGKKQSKAAVFFSLCIFFSFLIWTVLVFSGGNAVVFLHGFPEIWYSWRHQMIALADAGFRAIAFDYRGYGLSDPPSQPEKATWSDILNDLLHILQALHLPKVLSLSFSNVFILLIVSLISFNLFYTCGLLDFAFVSNFNCLLAMH